MERISTEAGEQEQPESIEALRQSEQLFRALIEKSFDAIVLLDHQGIMRYVSPSIERILGHTPEELLGRTPFEFVHPDDREQTMQAFAALMQDPATSVTVEYRSPHKDGSIRWMEGVGTNLLHDPKVGAIVGNFRDITERKELEQRKDEFIGMASHELKTPITSLKGFTNLLQRRFLKEGDEEALSLLDRMDKQIDKLTRLINEMLDISRIQTGKLEYHEEPFDLAQLVQEVMGNVQGTSRTHRLLLEEQTHVQVVADRDRIGQALINLLTNAIKYSPGADTVIIRLSASESEAHVSVQDFGIGIAREHQQKIFERFYQITSAEEKTFAGLGIGLYLSNEIIKRHHGRLWVESEKGKGATFHFTLPLVNK